MTTRSDIDSFYAFATQQLVGEQGDWSLEQCVLQWRQTQASQESHREPFSDGASLKDKLSAAGILGCGTQGPDDLASNPAHMQGFGES